MKLDSSVSSFDNFYSIPPAISADAYQIVETFFLNNTGSPTTAQSYALNLFRIAQITDQNVLDLLKNFEGQDAMNMTLTMAYYLNTVSDKTVMFGVSALPTPVFAVARNIVQ